MKYYFYLFLILVLGSCENNSEDIYRFSKIISQSKEYPVYLDMSEIGIIQVKAKFPLSTPFKILSNDKYYFVGDMLNGIHVYEMKAGSVSYLCFIACRYIKDFELADNKLFCNNLIDLLVIDVTNPLYINVLHRDKNQFNQFTSYVNYWNIPSVEGKGIIARSETHTLTGTVTDKQSNLDFSEYDQQYGNLTTTILPDSWFSNHPEYDKPYIGMVKVGTDEIYTWGTYNSWAICTFQSGTFNEREEDLWTSPRGKYAPPYYYSDSHPVKVYFQDSLIYILGAGYNNMGYSDCITYNEQYPFAYHMYFSTFKPVDITYMPTIGAFLVLSGQSVWGAFKDSNSVYMKKYVDYQIPTNATSIFRIGKNVVTLGNELKVYSPSEIELKLVKDYPDISGESYLITGNVLAIANVQGLFLYDITNLENIKLLP
jgi:hypothetical protein